MFISLIFTKTVQILIFGSVTIVDFNLTSVMAIIVILYEVIVWQGEIYIKYNHNSIWFKYMCYIDFSSYRCANALLWFKISLHLWHLSGLYS